MDLSINIYAKSLNQMDSNKTGVKHDETLDADSHAISPQVCVGAGH